MFENIKKLTKTDAKNSEFATAATPQAIYEEAELKYGPGFAQYCVDVLLEAQESLQKSPPTNQHMNNLIRLTSQLHTLSQVCSADFFQAWGTEDKLYYMTLLTTVSNDLSQALHGSLKEIKDGNNDETTIPNAQRG